MNYQKALLIWIDDDFGEPGGDRQGLVPDLQSQGGDQIEIKTLTPDDTFEQWIRDVEDKRSPVPDMILIDLFLRSSSFGRTYTLPTLDLGTKLVGRLETSDLLADVPKYLISRRIDEERAGRQTEHFDWIVTHNQLAQLGAAPIIADILDYRRLSHTLAGLDEVPPHKDVEKTSLLQDFVELFSPPANSHRHLVDLCRIYLDDLKRRRREGLGTIEFNEQRAGTDTHTTLDAGHWIRSTVLMRTGPLVTCQLAAALVGAREEAFEARVAPWIRETGSYCMYSGLFWRTARSSIWRQALIDFIMDHFTDLSVGPAQRFARACAHEIGLSDDELARCAVCGELWPDTVARDCEAFDEWRQVHTACSSAISEASVSVGFDPIREFEG